MVDGLIDALLLVGCWMLDVFQKFRVIIFCTVCQAHNLSGSTGNGSNGSIVTPVTQNPNY